MPHLSTFPPLDHACTTLFAAGLSEALHALVSAIVDSNANSPELRSSFETHLATTIAMGSRDDESMGNEAIRQVVQAVSERLSRSSHSHA